MSSLSLKLEMPSANCSTKKRMHDIDEEIEKLTQAVKNVSDGRLQAELEHSLLSAKLKRQKIAVMVAVSSTQMLLTEMQMLTAECDVHIELANIKRCKRLKLDPLNDQTNTSKSSTSSRSSSGTLKKETKKRYRSKKIDKENDKTVLVDGLDNRTVPKLVLTRSPMLSSNTSNSESSLTSSVLSEFNRPYVNENTQKKVEQNVANTKNSNRENTEKKLQLLPNFSHSLPVLPSNLNVNQPISSTPIKHSMPAVISRPSNNNIFIPRTQGYQHNTSLPPFYYSSSVYQNYIVKN